VSSRGNQRTLDARTEVRADWFYSREVVPGVWLLAEPQHVYTWLVEGNDRSVLLDTGMGFLPIRPLAESLTRRPLTVVNTHYHFDHIGGNYEFDEIAIHELGAPLITEGVPREVLDLYLGYARRQLEAAAEYRALDSNFFWLLTTESAPRAFPPDFDPASWTIRPTQATETLVDGDRIDLGGRVLTVLHAPGHSPDGICLLEEREGLLFGADTINAGPIYAQFPDSDVDVLAASTQRLADLREGIRLIMVHHFGRVIADAGFLPEIAEGLALVQAGEATLSAARDILDTPILEARFEHFSVALPDPEAEQPALSGTDGAEPPSD
jgi:glyoxylase-like metal-dependent hydrolase (beta-lactamase superfamily II)